MYSIPEETLNKIMNILGGLPYTQVAGLIQEMQNNIKKIDEPQRPSKEEKK